MWHTKTRILGLILLKLLTGVVHGAEEICASGSYVYVVVFVAY